MKRVTVIVLLVVSIVLSALSGCSSNQVIADSQNEAKISNATKKISSKFAPKFTATTTIMYSEGADSSWQYGNLRKEFKNGKPCYLQVNNVIKSSKKRGLKKEITVKYCFTGTENCEIEVADGIVKEIKTEDKNTQLFQRTVKPIKKNQEKDDKVTFRYNPKKADSVELKVIYDDLVDENYDEMSTIYFVNK